MIKTRDEYLKLHWSPYPAMPEGALFSGRLQNQYIGDKSIQGLFMLETDLNLQKFNATEILKEGDLVAILPQSKVVLLAPNLTDRKPESSHWPQYLEWSQFLDFVYQYFRENEFTCAHTPILVKCPGTEPSIEVFETQFKIGSKTKKLYLPTSPEINLKKLLSQGALNIFEIAHVFRNGEMTERHSPEFLMLEWYRAFANLNCIKTDVVKLVDYLAESLLKPKPAKIVTYSMAELFKMHCDFELKPDTSINELKTLATQLNIDVSAATTIDDYFYLIYIERIEHKWPDEALVFVEKYPPYQAALARIDAEGWAERFEVYWQGFEIGNAFHELNDPTLQRQRSQEDLEKKLILNKKEISLDPAFFEALDYGLPPSAGIAIGLERLYMALCQIKDISQINRIYKLWQNAD